MTFEATQLNGRGFPQTGQINLTQFNFYFDIEILAFWVAALCGMAAANQRFGRRAASIFRVEMRRQRDVCIENSPGNEPQITLALREFKWKAERKDM
jgi:hypothetical protein